MKSFYARNPLKPFAALVFCALLNGQAWGEGQRAPLPDPAIDTPLAKITTQNTAVFAGGCFWGVQAVFQHVKGVVSATSGYSGGEAKTAYYERVSDGDTGHAESVQVVYDPSKVSYGQLLKVYFAVAHNPMQLNRQGPDSGTQYRSEIFVSSIEQLKVANAYMQQLTASQVYPGKIVTRVSNLTAFYPAEAHHQDFLHLHPNHPYIVVNDLPKLDNLQATLPALYRQ